MSFCLFLHWQALDLNRIFSEPKPERNLKGVSKFILLSASERIMPDTVNPYCFGKVTSLLLSLASISDLEIRIIKLSSFLCFKTHTGKVQLQAEHSICTWDSKPIRAVDKIYTISWCSITREYRSARLNSNDKRIPQSLLEVSLILWLSFIHSGQKFHKIDIKRSQIINVMKQSLQTNTKEYIHSIQVKEADCEDIWEESAVIMQFIYELSDFNTEGQRTSIFVCENTFSTLSVFLSLHCNHISVDPQTPQ